MHTPVLPSVSIAIPSYNYGRYLGRSIASALAQTYPVAEVVVVENNSPDDSLEVARSFTDSRLRIVSQLRTVGGGINWNRCIEEVCGDWYVLLGADDQLHPEFVERALKCVLSNRQTVMIAGDYEVIDDADRVTDVVGPCRYLGEEFRGSTHPGHVVAEASLRHGDNPLGTPSMHMYHTAAARRINGYALDLPWVGDWDFMLRLLPLGVFGHLDGAYTRYRMHAASDTSRHGSTDTPLQGHVDLVRRLHAPGTAYDPTAHAARHAYTVKIAYRLVVQIQAVMARNEHDRVRKLLEYAKSPEFADIINVTAA